MMAKTILMIHGRSFKPPEASLRRLWFDAITHGLQRDHPPAKLRAFNSVRKEFIYYGGISNEFLSAKTGDPIPDDTAGRRKTLADLKKLGAGDFTKRNYQKLPGATPLKEFWADLFGPLLSTFHLSEGLIALVAPDMGEYWEPGTDFGSRLRATMIRPLMRAMDRGDKILVIAHSLGTLIAYDTFWKFSRMGEYREDYEDAKIDLFLSLGSPLADETVKRYLKGASSTKQRRYPGNIRRWVNVAAEDDYICHDERVKNDYKDMYRKKPRLIDSIQDVPIFNLSVREGKSNPHSSAGYLVHPKVAAILADWL